MSNYKKQPNNLKRIVTTGRRCVYFEMNVSKKRIIELLTSIYPNERIMPKQPIMIETNSVWYDKNGIEYISESE